MTFARLTVISISLALTAACGDDGGGGGGPNDFESGNSLSLRFDGEDDYGSAGDVADSLDETIESFSMSLWFKAEGSPAENATMMQFNPELESGAESMQVTFAWTGPDAIVVRLTPNAADGPSAEVNTTIEEPNAWNHLLVTFDATAGSDNILVYLNGLAAGSAGLTTPLETVGNVQFGRRGAGIDHFAGLLDEAALWASPLTEEEVVSVYNEGSPQDVSSDYEDYASSRTLRSLWRMGDENVGDELNVSDLISSNHFTVVGGGTFETDTP